MSPLRAIDVLVLAKLSVGTGEGFTYGPLAASLGISRGAAHSAVGRLRDARLLSSKLLVMSRHVAEVFAFGVEYFLPARLGPESAGVPTSFGVPPLQGHFGVRDDAPVWPSILGNARGPSVGPIYETVPFAATQDEALHRLLALIDAVRVGRAREVNLARVEIARMFGVEAW